MTAYNITDRQIRQLRREAATAGDHLQVLICEIALASILDDEIVMIAREACARVIADATEQAEQQ